MKRSTKNLLKYAALGIGGYFLLQKFMGGSSVAGLGYGNYPIAPGSDGNIMFMPPPPGYGRHRRGGLRWETPPNTFYSGYSPYGNQFGYGGNPNYDPLYTEAAGSLEARNAMLDAMGGSN